MDTPENGKQYSESITYDCTGKDSEADDYDIVRRVAKQIVSRKRGIVDPAMAP